MTNARIQPSSLVTFGHMFTLTSVAMQDILNLVLQDQLLSSLIHMQPIVIALNLISIVKENGNTH